MVSLGTQPANRRAALVTPRLPVRAPRIYPDNPHVRICGGWGRQRPWSTRPRPGLVSVRAVDLHGIYRPFSNPPGKGTWRAGDPSRYW